MLLSSYIIYHMYAVAGQPYIYADRAIYSANVLLPAQLLGALYVQLSRALALQLSHTSPFKTPIPSPFSSPVVFRPPLPVSSCSQVRCGAGCRDYPDGGPIAGVTYILRCILPRIVPLCPMLFLFSLFCDLETSCRAPPILSQTSTVNPNPLRYLTPTAAQGR